MARIARQEVEKREQKMLEIMEEHPDWSVNKANDEYFKHFESKMRSIRAYELQKIAREKVGHKSNSELIDADGPDQVTEAPKARLVQPAKAKPESKAKRPYVRKAEAAPSQVKTTYSLPKASPPRRAPTLAAREPQEESNVETEKETLMLLEGTPDQLAWFRKSISALKSGGLVNLVIEHAAANYAVVKAG